MRVVGDKYANVPSLNVIPADYMRAVQVDIGNRGGDTHDAHIQRQRKDNTLIVSVFVILIQ
jgi:hypothetical protein